MLHCPSIAIVFQIFLSVIRAYKVTITTPLFQLVQPGYPHERCSGFEGACQRSDHASQMEKPERKIDCELTLSSFNYQLHRSGEETSELGSSIESDTGEEVPMSKTGCRTPVEKSHLNLELTISSPNCS